MRRIFNNSTAIAVGVALLMPHAGIAQAAVSPTPNAEAAQAASDRATEMPDLQKALQMELDAGLTAEQLTCPMNAPTPCPAGLRFTPRGVAVEVAEDGTIFLAPKMMQTHQADAQGNLTLDPDAVMFSAPRPGTDKTSAADPVAVLAQNEATPPATATDAATVPPVPAADPAAGTAAPAEPPAADEPAADTPAEHAAETTAEPAAEAAPEPSVEPAAEPAAAPADAAPEAPAAQPAAEAPAASDADAAGDAASDAPADDAPAADATATDRPDAAALERALSADQQDDAAGTTDADRGNDAATDAPAASDAAPVPPAADAPAASDSAADTTAADAPAAGEERPDATELERALSADQADDAAAPSTDAATPATEPADAGAAGPASVTPDTAPETAPGGSTDGSAPATPATPPTAGTPGAAATAPGAAAQPGQPAGTASTPTVDQLRDALGAGSAAEPVPETRAAVTEAAKEAATETAPPTAAALEAPAEPTGEVVETVVMNENARSSAEDFTTSIRDAAAAAAAGAAAGAGAGAGAATQTTAGQGTATAAAGADDDDDDRNDLARMALAGVAGLVVGQMLSNNRQVALNTGDRVIVTRPDGSQEVIKNDNALLLRPGSTVQTENFADGSSRTSVLREDGSRVVTIRDADLRVLRRSLVRADGTVTTLIDDTVEVEPVDVADLPPPARPVLDTTRPFTEDELREALRREVGVDRRFTLSQIRNIPAVRALVAPVDIQAITFDTGSAAIAPEQAQQLAVLGNVIADAVRDNPREIFIVEGHTDTVGSDASNLALSDRRAESVALALTEYFQVPPENMVVQGYGEQILRVPVEGDVRENRRASIRRITDLLAQPQQ